VADRYPPEDERLTPPEVADMTNYREGTLKKWRSALCGPAFYRIPHKGYRVCYWLRDVEAWMASRRVDGRER